AWTKTSSGAHRQRPRELRDEQGAGRTRARDDHARVVRPGCRHLGSFSLLFLPIYSTMYVIEGPRTGDSARRRVATSHPVVSAPLRCPRLEDRTEARPWSTRWLSGERPRGRTTAAMRRRASPAGQTSAA